MTIEGDEYIYFFPKKIIHANEKIRVSFIRN